MPFYEYECCTCGVFTKLRKMCDSSQPAICEECGSKSSRILSPPRLAMMGKTQRVAYERNERAAHEPRAGRRSSCGCMGAHTCQTGSHNNKSAAAKVNPETGVPALQMQTRKSARPWMVGH